MFSLLLSFSMFFGVPMQIPSTRPKFKKPPVIEVVATVQFAELDNVMLLGNTESLHKAFGEKFKRIMPKMPLGKCVIPGVTEETPNHLSLAFMHEDHFQFPRIWYLSADETHLIQFQSDKLVFNWRKVGPDPETENSTYSTFESKVWTHFDRALKALNGLIVDRTGTALKIEAAELAYINSIPFKDFGGPANLHNCIKGLSLPSLEWQEPTKIVNFMWISNYDKYSTFTVQGLTGSDKMSGDAVLRLDLTTKGAFPNTIAPDSQMLHNWFNDSHLNIVNSFEKITDPTMHTKWGKS